MKNIITLLILFAFVSCTKETYIEGFESTKPQVKVISIEIPKGSQKAIVMTLDDKDYTFTCKYNYSVTPPAQYYSIDITGNVFYLIHSWGNDIMPISYNSTIDNQLFSGFGNSNSGKLVNMSFYNSTPNYYSQNGINIVGDYYIPFKVGNLYGWISVSIDQDKIVFKKYGYSSNFLVKAGVE